MNAWRALLIAGCLGAGAAQARPHVVVLDAGHGGAQHGAPGAGTWEKHVALDITRQVAARLQKRGPVKVVFTRAADIDVPLAERVALSNRAGADVFVSIHANSMPTRASRLRTEGVGTFFLSAEATGEEASKTAARENADAASAPRASTDLLGAILQDLRKSRAHQDASRLAYRVQSAVVQATGAVDRGVEQAPFYVLAGVEAPAILVETGYISHPREGPRLRLRAYQAKLADAIAASVWAFLAEGDALEAAARP